MSGWSDIGQCPRCGKDEIQIWGDHKPYESVNGVCFSCGFNYWAEDGLLSLEEVNQRRKEYEKEPLTELAKPREGWNDSSSDILFLIAVKKGCRLAVIPKTLEVKHCPKKLDIKWTSASKERVQLKTEISY